MALVSRKTAPPLKEHPLEKYTPLKLQGNSRHEEILPQFKNKTHVCHFFGIYGPFFLRGQNGFPKLFFWDEYVPIEFGQD